LNWGITVLQIYKSLLDHVISISYKGGVAKILPDSATPPQPFSTICKGKKCLLVEGSLLEFHHLKHKGQRIAFLYIRKSA